MVKSANGALLATIPIDRGSTTPIYRQLENFLRQLILDGTLPSRQKLPSTREFSEELGVSRITVKTVYEQLISEGYAEAKPGAGTFVSEGLILEKPLRPKLDKAEPNSHSRKFSEIVPHQYRTGKRSYRRDKYIMCS